MKALIPLIIIILSFGANAALIPTSINSLNDSGDELWTLTDSNGLFDDSGFELSFSFGSFNSPDHEFGLFQYDAASDSISDTLAIFDSNDSPGDRTNVIWNFVSDKVHTRHGNLDLMSGMTFGFYFQSDGKKFYSQAALNQGGKKHFGFYWNTDPFSTTNLIVYAGDNGRGLGYDHIQVSVDDVRPIPEPNTLALFGIALLGFRVLSKQGEFNL
jgi:hypothetical protein